MAEITAALVKDLREKTGAGMMDCKNALSAVARRHRGRHRLAAQEGPRQGRQEERPRRRRRSWSASPSRGRWASSSRSIRKPTSSRATRIFKPWCAASSPFR